MQKSRVRVCMRARMCACACVRACARVCACVRVSVSAVQVRIKLGPDFACVCPRLNLPSLPCAARPLHLPKTRSISDHTPVTHPHLHHTFVSCGSPTLSFSRTLPRAGYACGTLSLYPLRHATWPTLHCPPWSLQPCKTPLLFLVAPLVSGARFEPGIGLLHA